MTRVMMYGTCMAKIHNENHHGKKLKKKMTALEALG
jgi:hypothetical protein